MKLASKRFLRIIIGFIILTVVPYILIYFSINERGKDLFVKIIKEKYNLDVSVNNLSFSFPLTVTLTGFSLENENIYCRQIIVDLGPINPFTNSYYFHKVHLKGLRLDMDKDRLGLLFAEKINSLDQKLETGKFDLVYFQSFVPKPSLKINELILDKAYIFFSEPSLSPPLRIGIEKLSGSIRNITYPDLSKFFVDLKASLRVNKKKTSQNLEAAGWLDWRKKDMDVILSAKKLDYFIFEDYYPSFWKSENLELKEAKVSFDSHLKSKSDNLFIDYYISVDKVVFNENPESESKVKSYKTVLALFSRGGIPSVHFTYKTKMSSPSFDINSIGEGLVFQLKEKDISTASDAINIFFGRAQEAVGDGVGGLRGIVLDPVIEGVKGFGGELIKNIGKILGIELKKAEDDKEIMVEEKDLEFQEEMEQRFKEEISEKEKPDSDLADDKQILQEGSKSLSEEMIQN